MNAKTVLKKYWGDFLPVNPLTIALRLDLAVLLNPISSDIKCEFIKEENKIVINTKENITRIDFCLAHSIGHFCLGHNSQQDIVQNFQKTSEGIEKEANNFALDLLIPKDLLKAYIVVKEITNINKLKEIFNVSENALKMQLKKIGYL
jgi:Zn-dependent peptidase ImmA (M78 family)